MDVVFAVFVFAVFCSKTRETIRQHSRTALGKLGRFSPDTYCSFLGPSATQAPFGRAPVLLVVPVFLTRPVP